MLNIFKREVIESPTNADVITSGTVTRRIASELLLTQDHYQDTLGLDARKFGVIVPTTVHDIDAKEVVVNTVVEQVAKYISKVAGGATITPQWGCYWDTDKGLIEERSYYVWAHGNKENLAELSLLVHRLGNIVGSLLSQDSMLIYVADNPQLLNNW